MENFICERCGNRDPRYIGFKNGKPYCRRCISFQGESVSYEKPLPKRAPLNLHYGLSQDQARLSEKIVSNFKNGIDTLVYAVCWAGKTEISYAVISYAISQGMTVGFALPRRDVVVELFYRLKESFPENKVVAVFGQHTSVLKGDIIILTTHQLFRYPNYFDLLVMDEIDAFPFKDNPVLIAMYRRAMRGSCVLMSATPSENVIQEFKKPDHEILELRTRFHHQEIPLPQTKIMPSFLQPLFVVAKLLHYKKEGKCCFVFTPSIEECEMLYRFVSCFVKGGSFVHSKKENRQETIGIFKKKGYFYLITTSVLERGVTFKNLQVMVTHADRESIYSSSALIQIAGRVGRKSDAPGGDVIFLGEVESKAMKDAHDEIQFCNTFL